MSENPTIFQALSAVMADLGPVAKTGVNAQQGYRFRGIDAIMNALHPLLAKHGVIIAPRVVERISEERPTKSGATMTITHLHVSFTFYGPAGDYITCDTWGEAQDSADKSTNKAMSAALKYALLQTLCIPTEDMDDADRETSERPVADPTLGVKKAIAAEWSRLGMTVATGSAAFKELSGLDIRSADPAMLDDYLRTLQKQAVA